MPTRARGAAPGRPDAGRRPAELRPPGGRRPRRLRRRGRGCLDGGHRPQGRRRRRHPVPALPQADRPGRGRLHRPTSTSSIEAADEAVATLEPWPAVVAFLEAFVRYAQSKRTFLNELREAFEKHPNLKLASRERIDEATARVIERAQRAGVRPARCRGGRRDPAARPDVHEPHHHPRTDDAPAAHDPRRPAPTGTCRLLTLSRRARSCRRPDRSRSSTPCAAAAPPRPPRSFSSTWLRRAPKSAGPYRPCRPCRPSCLPCWRPRSATLRTPTARPGGSFSYAVPSTVAMVYLALDLSSSTGGDNRSVRPPRWPDLRSRPAPPPDRSVASRPSSRRRARGTRRSRRRRRRTGIRIRSTRS